MHELPKAWLPNARKNDTDAAEMSREELGKSERVSCGGGLSETHQTLHYGQMDNYGGADDEEMLETTKMAVDVDTSKPVESVHAVPESIKTSLAEHNHVISSRPSVPRQSCTPEPEAKTQSQPPDAGSESEAPPSRSPSIVFLYSSADSEIPELKTSVKRGLADYDLHGEDSKRVKQEKAQQKAIKLEEAEEGTKGSFSKQKSDMA